MRFTSFKSNRSKFELLWDAFAVEHRNRTKILVGFSTFAVFAVSLLFCISSVNGQTARTGTGQLNQMPANIDPASNNPTNLEAPSLDAPNIAKPNTIPSSRGFTGAVNPDGSLPIRPGAIVNPRGARHAAQGQNVQGQNVQGQNIQLAQAGQPIVSDRIRNTGIPGGNSQPQPGRPQGQPVPQPARPQQAVPNVGQPFPQLTVEEAAELDQFLALWERRTRSIKIFESEFYCWEYGKNLLENPEATKADYCVYGMVRFAAPNRGSYEILGEFVNGKREEGKYKSKILSSGDAVLDYDFKDKVVSIQKIPEDQQHELAGGGPLAFLFGTNPEAMKKRFYLRLNTRPERAKMGEIWLEAYPRFSEDAGEFKKVHLVVDRKEIIPKAFIQYEPNEKGKRTFEFLRKTMRISPDEKNYEKFVARYLTPSIPKDWTRDIKGVPQAESPQIANSGQQRPLSVQTVNPNPAYTNQHSNNLPAPNQPNPNQPQNPQHNQVRPITPQPQPQQNQQNLVETPLYNTTQSNRTSRY